MIDGLTDGIVVGSRKKRTRDIGGVRVERQKETCASKSKKQFEKQMASENYTCMHMTLNIKRHINFLIRHIIY